MINIGKINITALFLLICILLGFTLGAIPCAAADTEEADEADKNDKTEETEIVKVNLKGEDRLGTKKIEWKSFSVWIVAIIAAIVVAIFVQSDRFKNMIGRKGKSDKK